MNTKQLDANEVLSQCNTLKIRYFDLSETLNTVNTELSTCHSLISKIAEKLGLATSDRISVEEILESLDSRLIPEEQEEQNED